MQTEQLLRWSDKTDTEHTTSGSVLKRSDVFEGSAFI